MANVCSYKGFTIMVKVVLPMEGLMRTLFSEALTIVTTSILLLFGNL